MNIFHGFETESRNLLHIKQCKQTRLNDLLFDWVRGAVTIIQHPFSFFDLWKGGSLAEDLNAVKRGEKPARGTPNYYLEMARVILDNWGSYEKGELETFSRLTTITRTDYNLHGSLSPYRTVSAYLLSSLREAFGEWEKRISLPLAPVNADIQGIAQAIKDGSPDHPVMADALEDAGFTFQPVLDHLRTTRHVGVSSPCWSVYIALNKHPLQRASQRKIIFSPQLD